MLVDRCHLERVACHRSLVCGDTFCMAIDHGKQLLEITNALRRSQKQIAMGIQGKVEQGDQFLLQFTPQVDQQISTTDQIQLREWRDLC